MQNTRNMGLAVSLLLLSTACSNTAVYENARPRATVYRDVQDASAAGGIGVESRDIVSMTDDMMRDLLASGVLAGRGKAPRVIVDSKYLRNESSARINKNIITDILRTELIRASLGRVVFVNRELVEMAETERALKRDGVVDSGTIRLTQATAGADFRLAGRIASMDAVNAATGVHDKTYVLTFELIDLEMSAAIYALGPYTISKFGSDDVVYR